MADGNKPAASGSADEDAVGGMLGAMASWGGGMWNYTAATISSVGATVGSYLGLYEDLEVIDPDSEEAEHKNTDAEDLRQKEFMNYRDYIGMDITSLVTLPVWIMEPFTMLQKIAEIMEYTEHLDRAALTEDPYERLAWVVAFTMGSYGAVERTWKPFNPILGETFELDLENGTRFIAEQVSHHPPVGAGHGENTNWSYDIVSAPATKFLGNSVDIYPIGRTRIKLKSTGEVFSLVPCNCKAHNVIMGRTWVDSYGNFTVLNATSGAKCSLYFTPCGWFSAGRYDVSGHILTPDGKKVIALSGKWNSHMDMVKCDEEGDPLPGAETVRLWTCNPKPAGDKYGFTNFAHRLNSGKGVAPLPSDSRRRADRLALEVGEVMAAGNEKYALEEHQRVERKERERRGDSWLPRWFRPSEDKQVYSCEFSPEECPMWDCTRAYFEQPRKPAAADDDCAGKAFAPWQYDDVAA